MERFGGIDIVVPEGVEVVVTGFPLMGGIERGSIKIGARAGLGLTLTYRIVQAHHGKMWIDSAVGRGTSVTILLPAASGRAHLR